MQKYLFFFVQDKQSFLPGVVSPAKPHYAIEPNKALEEFYVYLGNYLYNFILLQYNYENIEDLINIFKRYTDKQYHKKLEKCKTPSDIIHTSLDPITLLKHYKVYSVVEDNSCFGCQNNSPRQSDHMDCFDGCLHDKEVCRFC